MKYRDPLGVEIKIGQKVVYLDSFLTPTLEIGDVYEVNENGTIGICRRLVTEKTLHEQRDHTEIYVVGLDK